MKLNKHLAVRLGSLAGGVLALALTGCTTDEQGPGAGGAYYAPSEPADASYAEIRSESDFYEPLSPYGRWEVVGSYGRCWIPAGVAADWSPYANGYWQRTDAGWYWASDEPWGWATYHYGRWDSSPQFGWYWVPQTQWAPAWVSWREGGGYVGWAPMGPSGRGVVTVGIRGEASRGFVFVEERRFLDPVRRSTVMVNNTIITNTVINQGPGAAAIERASGRKMPAVSVRQLRSREEAKVGVRHPAPAATSARAVQTPVSRQAEKPSPAPVPHRVEKPAVTTAKPQTPVSHPAPRTTPAPVSRPVEQPAVATAKPHSPVARQAEQAPPAHQARPVEKPGETVAAPPAPVTRNDVRPADNQGRPANLDKPKPAPQQNARVAESKVRSSGVAVAEAKPVTKPAATRKPPEPKVAKDDENKDSR